MYQKSSSSQDSSSDLDLLLEVDEMCHICCTCKSTCQRRKCSCKKAILFCSSLSLLHLTKVSLEMQTHYFISIFPVLSIHSNFLCLTYAILPPLFIINLIIFFKIIFSDDLTGSEIMCDCMALI